MRSFVLALIFAAGAPLSAQACPPDVITRLNMKPSAAMTDTINQACALKPDTCEYVNIGACHALVNKELRDEGVISSKLPPPPPQ